MPSTHHCRPPGLYAAAVSINAVQAERDRVEHEVTQHKLRLADAHERQAAMQRQRVELSSRRANATAGLAGLRATHPPRNSTAASAAARSTSSSRSSASATTATYVAAQACLRDPGAARPLDHRLPAAAARPPLQASSVSTLVPCNRRDVHGSLFTPWVQAPPPIQSFPHTSDICIADLCAVAGVAQGLLDFTQHSIASLIDKAMAEKCAQSGAAPGSVCWFVQTNYSITPDRRLSVSSSLSSPECLAAFVLQFMLTRLELALVTHANDQVCTAGQHTSPAAGTSDPAPGRKARRHDIKTPSPLGAMPTSCLPGGDTSGLGRQFGGADARCTSDYIAGRSPHPGAHGFVRCGVNELHDANAAVSVLIRSIVQRFCHLAPLDGIARLLQAYHASLQRRCSIVGATPGNIAAADTAGAEPGGYGEEQRRTARSVRAVRSVMMLVLEAVGSIADTRMLWKLVRASPKQRIALSGCRRDALKTSPLACSAGCAAVKAAQRVCEPDGCDAYSRAPPTWSFRRGC